MQREKIEFYGEKKQGEREREVGKIKKRGKEKNKRSVTLRERRRVKARERGWENV